MPSDNLLRSLDDLAVYFRMNLELLLFMKSFDFSSIVATSFRPRDEILLRYLSLVESFQVNFLCGLQISMFFYAILGALAMTLQCSKGG